MDSNGNLIYEKQSGQEVKQIELVPIADDFNMPWSR
jgi:hypothetical protein